MKTDGRVLKAHKLKGTKIIYGADRVLSVAVVYVRWNCKSG
jgi:hypothetical protein